MSSEHMAEIVSILGRIHTLVEQLEGEAKSRFVFSLVAVGTAIYGQTKGVDATREMLVSLAECSGGAQAEVDDEWEAFE